MGVIVARKGRDSSGVEKQVADFIEGENCTVVDLSKEVDTDKLANVVVGTTTSSSVDPPLTSIIRNEDPTSLLSVTRGFLLVKGSESDTITTQAELDRLVRQRLEESQSLTVVLQLTHGLS